MPPLLMCTVAASLLPGTYVGTRLGVTATVVLREDAPDAQLTLRTGPFTVAEGGTRLTPAGGLRMDAHVLRALSARGVTVVDAVPSDDGYIDVRTRVRFLGGVDVRLERQHHPP